MSAEACESEDLSDPGVLHRGGRFRNSSSISLRGERGGQVAPSGWVVVPRGIHALRVDTSVATAPWRPWDPRGFLSEE